MVVTAHFSAAFHCRVLPLRPSLFELFGDHIPALLSMYVFNILRMLVLAFRAILTAVLIGAVYFICLYPYALLYRVCNWAAYKNFFGAQSSITNFKTRTQQYFEPSSFERPW